MIKLLLDEDLSPANAHILCREYAIDATSLRDRGQLSIQDHEVFEYAFSEDRIIVTANVVHFERLAGTSELHCGIIFFKEGNLLREEQLIVLRSAIELLQQELEEGRDMANRTLYIDSEGSHHFEDNPTP